MTTASTNWTVSELPGLDKATTITALPTDAAGKIVVDANYIRLAEGHPIERHIAVGDVLLFCILGEIDVEVNEQQHCIMSPNQMLHVAGGIPYRMEAKQDSAVLVTSLTNEQSPDDLAQQKIDRNKEVDEALEETFPASDPPSYNASTA